MICGTSSCHMAVSVPLLSFVYYIFFKKIRDILLYLFFWTMYLFIATPLHVGKERQKQCLMHFIAIFRTQAEQWNTVGSGRHYRISLQLIILSFIPSISWLIGYNFSLHSCLLQNHVFSWYNSENEEMQLERNLLPLHGQCFCRHECMFFFWFYFSHGLHLVKSEWLQLSPDQWAAAVCAGGVGSLPVRHGPRRVA